MLRDFKFLHRNSSNNSLVDEIENVPVNSSDSLVVQGDIDSSRPPLNTIQEHAKNTKPDFEQETKRTPTKAKGKITDTSLPLRTPDKHTFSARNRFGWGQKNEPGSVGSEFRDEARADTKDHLVQSNNGTGYVKSSHGTGYGNGVYSNMTPRSTTRMVSRANSESNSIQTTPTKSVSKPPNPGLRSKVDGNGGVRSGNFPALYKGMPITCAPPSTVNTIEVPHFDLKEDPSFWMDHNVQVLIRIRPLNSMEKSTHGFSRCLKQENAHTVSWAAQPETRFTFDQIACETVDQEMLFKTAGLPMVENCLSGYNSCMFAYGQTGSGKTHTMLGDIDDLEVRPSPNRGMTPRIFEFLFARIRAEEESRRDERLQYNCKCSFLEIYNEQITDLLEPSSTNLLLREDMNNGVYVENLSEFEVQTVSDILKLLLLGSSNRKVASTNMNRESSRSHSVFTCVIESRWEKDSTSNLRFARLNLVDLAGSERQKTSGAEGERLKEAANINKSLSTLGHVIMVLLEVANGKPKHIPYRDSRLTFLLQDSLGGNSKTMIIANVSPSICCAAETLNTLKFAQRAKLIQNNAVVNEDSSGDVTALQHQIRLLKEELSILKRQNISRSLSFGPSIDQSSARVLEGPQNVDNLVESESRGIVRLSTKQLKSLETTLAGALRREQMAETSIKQLEAEIEQLNRLVRQREEENRSTKMTLRFREDKINRMGSLLDGAIPADAYLLQENSALSEEIQLLQAKVDRNPEVTRFASENIRLIEQVRRFQEFYEEGEREILLAEVSELRDQLCQHLDGNSKQQSHRNSKMDSQEEVHLKKGHELLQSELENSLSELNKCKSKLNSCLEENAKMSREIQDLRSLLDNSPSAPVDNKNDSVNVLESTSVEGKQESLINCHREEIVNLELELDILKVILKEEKASRTEAEEKIICLTSDLDQTNEAFFLMSKDCEDAKQELKNSKSIIEALESQQILLINEMEDLKKINNFALKDNSPAIKYSSSISVDSPLKTKLKKMQASLEKAKRLNMAYKTDHEFTTTNKEEMDEVCRQAEAETAEVIVCLQEELAIHQQQVQDSNLKQMELQEKLSLVTQDNESLCTKLLVKDEEFTLLQTQLKEIQENMFLLTQGNESLCGNLVEKEGELRLLQNLLKEQQEKVCLLTEDNENLSTKLVETNMELLPLQIQLKDGQEKMRLMTQDIENLCAKLLENDVELTISQTQMKELLQKLCLLTQDNEELCGEFMEKEVESTFLKTLLKKLQEKMCYMTEDYEIFCENLGKKDVELTFSQTQLKKLQEKMCLMTRDNEKLCGKLVEKEVELTTVSEEWEILTHEIEESLSIGHEEILDASHQLEIISSSFPQKKTWASEKVCKMIKIISEKEITIAELKRCLEEANNKRGDMECMLKSLRGATMAITDAHQKELSEKEREILYLTAQVSAGTSLIENLENKIKMGEDQIKKASDCATVAFVIVNRLSELNANNSISLQNKDLLIEEAELKIKNVEENDIFNTRQKLEELKASVSTLKTSMNMPVKSPEQEYTAVDDGIWINENCDGRTTDSNLKADVSCCSIAVGGNSVIISSRPEVKSSNVFNREFTILLLKKELESAIESLKEVDAEIMKLRGEKQELWVSEKQSRENMKHLVAQVFALQASMLSFEEQALLKMDNFDSELVAVEHILRETCDSWCKTKETMEVEVSNAIMDAVQKEAEASCILSKYVEAQDTMKDAEFIIKGLLIANETMRFELTLLKNEKNDLISKVQNLESANNLKDQQCTNLEELCGSNLTELEEIVALVQNTTMDDFKSIAHDIHLMKSEFVDTTKLMQSWVEDMLTEIFFKDCAVSVLHLCHTGILLETVTGLNAENGFLRHGLSESNSIIADLREHNLKCRKELEICRVLKGKLLADIKNSFDRISRKEEGTGQLSMKLTTFEKRIMDLQIQEELMLQRFNDMESELSVLTKDLDTNALKEKEEALALQEEFYINQLLSKEFQVLMLESGLKEMTTDKIDIEREKKSSLAVLENLKNEFIFLKIDEELKNLLLRYYKVDVDNLELENQKLQKEVCKLESLSEKLTKELAMKDGELEKMSCVEAVNMSLNEDLMKLKTDYSMIFQDLCSKNNILKNEVSSQVTNNHEVLTLSNLYTNKCLNSVDTVSLLSSSISKKLEKLNSVDTFFQEICQVVERTSNFTEDLDYIENFAKDLSSEIISLHTELVKKDDIIKELVFELSLLQESSISNSLGQKDEIEEIRAALEAVEDDLQVKTRELNEAVTQAQNLEAKLQENMEIIYTLELEISQEQEKSDILEMERTKLNELVDATANSLNEVTNERDHLQIEVLQLREKLEMAEAEAEENEAIAAEAQQLAESRKEFAEEKEEEIKLLEKSVEELECTIDVLENKVGIVKEEAERQRLQREEMESELQVVKYQLQHVRSGDEEMERYLNEKEKELQESLKRVQILEIDIADREAEISKYKSHISELNLHAEAQACEYKQKFRALEGMVEQVKLEGCSSNAANSSSSNKLEKNASKSRGSGSPFKCIGLGLVQQLKSEKEEELTNARLRIEELEALAISRQKEIFILNSRLASAESMTHDVLRDLVGLKLDVTNYATLLDKHQMQNINAQEDFSEESQVKEDDALKLKQQLREFIEERKGLIEEIDRKQAELIAAQISLEKLRQQDQFLKAENEMLKMDNDHHKKKVFELEGEMKKLSGQQNLQQRIHHHAKIKEENNLLRIQNEDLNTKLRRAEKIIARVKEERACFRASIGKTPHNYDEEEQLNNKLKETEEERIQLAQKLLRLCSSILKVAGLKTPVSDINLPMAEEALELLENRITSLEIELDELKFKNRITSEKSRLSELMPQLSPLSSRTGSNHQSPKRRISPHAPFFSSLDR